MKIFYKIHFHSKIFYFYSIPTIQQNIFDFNVTFPLFSDNFSLFWKSLKKVKKYPPTPGGGQKHPPPRTPQNLSGIISTPKMQGGGFRKYPKFAVFPQQKSS